MARNHSATTFFSPAVEAGVVMSNETLVHNRVQKLVNAIDSVRIALPLADQLQPSPETVRLAVEQVAKMVHQEAEVGTDSAVPVEQMPVYAENISARKLTPLEQAELAVKEAFANRSQVQTPLDQELRFEDAA